MIDPHTLLELASTGKEKDYWTTAKGEQIKYKDLEDAHLKNIIKDGYRNLMIYREAKRRGFEVPTRAVEKMSFMELQMWLESFASCTIEGNEFGQEMLDLYENNKPLFYLKMNAFLEANQKEDHA